MQARDVMSTGVVTLEPDNSVAHAARMMREFNVSGLPVVNDEGRMIGMLTEGDLLRRAEIGACFADLARKGWKYGDPMPFVRIHSWKVSDVMSTPVIAVEEDATLSEIANLFLDNEIKRVPVMRGAHLVGIVSRADLLKCIEAGGPDAIAGGDEALRLAIETRLKELGSLREMPDISVTDGVVEMHGTLPTEDDRKAVRVVIEGIKGVMGIEDHLEIH